MGNSYTRQSSADIVDGNVVEAGPLNAEFNALQNFADGTTGHTHDGTLGEGPKISLTSSVSGSLPIENGGHGGTTAAEARTNLGLAVGSNVQAYDAGLQSISGLTTAANQMLYTTGLDLYATTALTPFARTILDDADAATVKATLGLATVATSASASDLTSGTIADARLPGTMAGKVFNGISVFNPPSGTATSVVVDGGTGSVELYNLAGPYIDFKNAAGDDYDSRIQLVGGNTLNFFTNADVLANGQKIWTAGNDGPGSGLDADLLDGYDATTLPVSTPVQTALNSKQNSLGFTPVQQGGGTGQGSNKVYIGWLGTSQIGLQVDGSNFGNIWPHSISGTSARLFDAGNTGGNSMVFNWNGQAGMPPWVWGGSDGQNMFVYNPANFTVTNSAQLGGIAASSYATTSAVNASIAAAAYVPFTSSQQVITNGGQLVIAHGLGVTPGNVVGSLVCVTAENGYSVGDIIMQPLIALFATASYGATATVNSTNVTVRIADSGFAQTQKNTGTVAALTSANWRLVIKAYK